MSQRGSDVRPRYLRFLRRGGQGSTGTMTLVEHLQELRRRVVYSVLAFLLISIIAFVAYNPIARFFLHPLCTLPRRELGLLHTNGCHLIYTGVLGALSFRFKLTVLVGIAASSPIWLYHVYSFVVPALTPKEK